MNDQIIYTRNYLKALIRHEIMMRNKDPDVGYVCSDGVLKLLFDGKVSDVSNYYFPHNGDYFVGKYFISDMWRTIFNELNVDIAICSYDLFDYSVKRAEKLSYIEEDIIDEENVSDIESAKNVVSKYFFAIDYISDKFKNNRDFVMSVVENNGLSLEYASNKIKKDREVIMTAVKQNGLALEFALDGLKADLEVVTVAINQNPTARKYASNKIKKQFI